jgi:hypothetical protein
MTFLDLLEPVTLALVNHSDPLIVHPLVRPRELPALPFSAPWPWYPTSLPHWGIAPEQGTLRLWFAGRPQGQEFTAFLDTLMAVGRGRRLAISPLTAETLGTLTLRATIAVLTTPG